MSTVAEVKASRASVRTIKSAYTSFVTSLVNKFNGGQAITAADLTNLVLTKYDPLTYAMNDLGAKIDALPDTATNYLLDNSGGVLLDNFGNPLIAAFTGS
jgi:hypothetical protein